MTASQRVRRRMMSRATARSSADWRGPRCWASCMMWLPAIGTRRPQGCRPRRSRPSRVRRGAWRMRSSSTSRPAADSGSILRAAPPSTPTQTSRVRRSGNWRRCSSIPMIRMTGGKLQPVARRVPRGEPSGAPVHWRARGCGGRIDAGHHRFRWRSVWRRSTPRFARRATSWTPHSLSGCMRRSDTVRR